MNEYSISWQLDGINDDELDSMDEDEEIPENDRNIDADFKPRLNIINTNARSLCPKINSLIDCYEELDVTLGVVTKTWLASGQSLDADIQDLADGAGLEM